MIGGINNGGWAVQKTDSAKVATDLLAKADDILQGTEKPTRQTALTRPADQDTGDGGIGYARGFPADVQLGDELAAQLDQSRFSREEIAVRNPTAQTVFTSLDVENKGYLDRQALQAAFDKMSDDSQANAQKVEQLLQELADGNEQISADQFAAGVSQIAPQDASAADALSSADVTDVVAESAPVPAALGVPVQSTAVENSSVADMNSDGLVGLQELVSFQTKQAQVQQVEQTSQQERDIVNRITTQLVQTYGRFDAQVANATAQVNPFNTTA
ncbi:MAG: hypothetical protein REI95_01360 [Oxalicibacterium faecigallinarum]|uniref:hypothetical protein n=1 Tax=Oxalicibacterium faecigallinarum TaxID=573741 RepID=UPI0028067275|nr:hypothetical protein [Oxalicibacterium faecigallinarum]MDQ7968265.1 hypothetical protein [Oxalicibacterium faecigallinarum]